MTENCDFKLKVSVVGDMSVGKAAIITRYTQDKFAPSHTHLGMDCECLLHVVT